MSKKKSRKNHSLEKIILATAMSRTGEVGKFMLPTERSIL